MVELIKRALWIFFKFIFEKLEQPIIIEQIYNLVSDLYLSSVVDSIETDNSYAMMQNFCIAFRIFYILYKIESFK